MRLRPADPAEEPRALVRQQLVKALGETGDSGVTDVLMFTLHNDEDPLVRVVAARALAEIGDPSSGDGLVLALREEDHSWVVAAVAGALGTVGAAPDLGIPRAIEVLRSRFHALSEAKQRKVRLRLRESHQ